MLKVFELHQACFFNVWPPSGANRFAEILSLAANSLSLAEKYFSLLRKSFNFRCKTIEFKWEALEFIKISLSLAKILSLAMNVEKTSLDYAHLIFIGFSRNSLNVLINIFGPAIKAGMERPGIGGNLTSDQKLFTTLVKLHSGAFDR